MYILSVIHMYIHISNVTWESWRHQLQQWCRALSRMIASHNVWVSIDYLILEAKAWPFTVGLQIISSWTVRHLFLFPLACLCLLWLHIWITHVNLLLLLEEPTATPNSKLDIQCSKISVFKFNHTHYSNNHVKTYLLWRAHQLILVLLNYSQRWEHWKGWGSGWWLQHVLRNDWHP